MNDRIIGKQMKREMCHINYGDIFLIMMGGVCYEAEKISKLVGGFDDNHSAVYVSRKL